MADDPRAELAELARLFQTHILWQRELGASELPRASARPSPPRSSPAAAAEVPSSAPTPTQELQVESAPSVEPRPTAPPEPPSPPIAAAGEAPHPAEPPLGRADALAVIRREVHGCTACKLAARRTQTVFARGNPDARLVFIGEAPGEQEDKQGLPFVGPAGQLLDKIIGAMTLDPAQVYVCNVVKCRPPGNRTPEADEVTACTPFLLRQLGVVRPEVIVALGRTATGFLLGSSAPMSKLRGGWHSYQGIPLLPTWHPSYLLREPAHKAETWADMKLVMQRLGLGLPARG